MSKALIKDASKLFKDDAEELAYLRKWEKTVIVEIMALQREVQYQTSITRRLREALVQAVYALTLDAPRAARIEFVQSEQRDNMMSALAKLARTELREALSHHLSFNKG